MIWPIICSLALNLVFLAMTLGTETTQLHDEGQNVTIRCPDLDNIRRSIQWVISDVSVKKSHPNFFTQLDGSIFIENATASDSHVYSCQDEQTNQSLGSVKLTIRTVPPAVTDLSVIPHSVYALVTWQVHGNGGYPIEHYILKYRTSESFNSSSEQWKVIDDIQPNTSSVSIYQLQPNSTYYFRLQAVNKIGASHEVTVMATTKHDLSEIEKANELLSAEEQESSKLFVRVTITAICLVVVTFAILALGISLVLFRNCGRRNVHTELNCEVTEEQEELMELVPHITLNPMAINSASEVELLPFGSDMLEYIEAEVSPTDACERTNLVQVASNGGKTSGSVQ